MHILNKKILFCINAKATVVKVLNVHVKVYLAYF